jgi:hypothetical protein
VRCSQNLLASDCFVVGVVAAVAVGPVDVFVVVVAVVASSGRYQMDPRGEADAQRVVRGNAPAVLGSSMKHHGLVFGTTESQM